MTDSEDNLLRVAKSDPNSKTRRTALVQLREMRSEKLRPLLIELLKKEEQNQNLRETAIKALGEVGLEADLALLRKIADGETKEFARFGKSAAQNAYAHLASRFRPSALATDWTAWEVEAATSDYFDMLTREIRGEAFSKAAHRRALAPLLSNRSDSSIERKHQNISAVLIGLGYPYISGYKPLGNYQKLLAEVATARVVNDRGLAATVSQAVAQSASVPSLSDILAIVEDPPESAAFVYPPWGERSHAAHLSRAPINYLEREANNSSLGRAGEEFVLSFERARLTRLGLKNLAERVEHVSVSEGDGTGYDIRSFEAHGLDRFIEVKTTAYGKQTPFFVSRNEVGVSRDHGSMFHLYRLFEFRKDPKLYMLNGSLEQVCRLEAIQFAARPA